jgi:hypothetical protein
MDCHALGDTFVEESLVNLVKEGIFEFWGIFELMGVPELEKERSGRICARKGRREVRIERIGRRGEQKRTTAVPDSPPATETTVRIGNLRIDLGTNLCNVKFATHDHFVECLHVSKRDFPFKWGIFEPLEQSFVNEGVVWASGDTEF